MVTTVGTDGQLVIEKEILEELGIEPGWTAIPQVVDGHLEIHFVPPKHNRSLLGALAPYTDIRIPDEDAFHEATERAWEEHAKELVARWREQVDDLDEPHSKTPCE
jgi:bifunctional DNA-binding transcriptional regulator/antitoxin component of YhaV-PrlF toxin-antitoxin module